MYKVSNIYNNIYKNLFLESIGFSFYNFGILISYMANKLSFDLSFYVKIIFFIYNLWSINTSIIKQLSICSETKVVWIPRSGELPSAIASWSIDFKGCRELRSFDVLLLITKFPSIKARNPIKVHRRHLSSTFRKLLQLFGNYFDTKINFEKKMFCKNFLDY